MRGNKNQPTLKIGQLAKRFDLNVRTLRYYEEIGILPAARMASGYRLYSEGDAVRLGFVLQAKRVGFTLEEIQEVIRLGEHGKACDYVKQTLARHLETINQRLRELEAVRSELSALSAEWQAPQKSCQADGRLCTLIEEWASLTPEHKEIETMSIGKQQVEVFTAGCPLCEPVVEMVNRLACSNCKVTVYNVKDNVKAQERAKAAGVTRVPMVLVDGKPASCCLSGAVTEEGLRASGIGAT